MALTSSAPLETAGALGTQWPRIRHVPDYVSSAGQEAVELCRLAGLALDPWEEQTLVDALGERRDGKWAAFEVGVDVPRQNGKGTVLEAREITGLFLLDEKLIVHSAHEQITSSEHFRRILNLIEGVPEFDRRVLKVTKGKGSEAIELRGGQRIFFKTRTGGGGRGLTGDLVVLDEAMILPVATTAALVPTMAARSITGNPQLWYAGSAVDQDKHEHGTVFARVRARGLDGAPRLMWVEWSADVAAWLQARGLKFDPQRPEIDQITTELLSDPKLWAQANPGLGIRISLDHISNERGGALGPREFAVERLGVGDWPDISEDSGRVIGRESWERLAETDRTKRITIAETFAVDVNPDRTWGSIGVGGMRDDSLWQVAVVEHKRSTGWIVQRCVELHVEHPEARFVVDPGSPAATIIDDLKEAGIDPVETSAQDVGDAFGDFVDEVDQQGLRYPAPQPDLDQALAAARKQALGDKWKWSRKNSTSADISPLVAVTLALWGARTLEPQYATVLYGSDHTPAEPEEPEIGPGFPKVISQDDYTTCFACSQGGRCPIHSTQGAP